MKKVLYTSIVSFFMFIPQVFAQEDIFGQNELGNEGIALGTKSIPEIAAGIINIFLGLLGVIAVTLILYGGFLWMTSKGNEDQIKKAKMLMVNAVIGLIIITSAYAISRFVLSKLSEATGVDDIVIIDDPDNPYYPDPTCIDNGALNICNISPSNGTIGSFVDIIGYNFGGIQGTVTFNGINAEVVACGGASPIWEDNRIKVVVPEIFDTLPITADVAVNSDSGETDTDYFTINEGEAGLNIAYVSPSEGPQGLSNVEICGINFGDDSGSATMYGFDNGSIEVVLTINTWSDELIDVDISSYAITSDIIVTGDNGDSDDEYFRVTCLSNDQCTTGCCSDNSCYLEHICIEGTGSSGPHIDYLSPDNGTSGNLITIFGSDFGEPAGNVYFSNSNGNRILGNIPSNLNNSCSIDYWFDDHIIIGVPNNVVDGEVDVLTSSGEYSNVVNFDENGIVRSGICLADPNEGSYGTEVYVYGVNFETTSQLYFGSYLGNNTVIDNSNNNANSDVPLITGPINITIDTGGEVSNPYPFLATEIAGGLPIISNISPLNGPIGEYITIMGANFGYYIPNFSDVIFDDGVNQISASFDFPAQCSQNFWQEDSIVAKVPDSISHNNFYIYIIRGEDAQESDPYTDQFTVNLFPPNPGICLMQPSNGPEGMEVNFYGEYFGDTTGDVVFYNNQNADLSEVTWNDNQVLNAKVPSGAQSGEVEIISSYGTDSNNMMFNVGSCPNDTYCSTSGLGDYCCPSNTGDYCDDICTDGSNNCEYSWTITTTDGVPNEEQLQVTGHDPNCDGSCTSPLIQVHFNTNISEDSINPSDFTITEDNNQFIIDSVVLESERTIRLEYTTPLNAGSTYEVTIPTSFSNVFGDNLDSPYLYTFTTGSDECVVDSVDVNPANAVSDATGDLTSFTAEPIDSSASCDIPIYCPNCLYSWSSTNTGIASIQSGSTIETVVLQTVLTSGYGQTKAEVVLTDDGNEHLDDGILDVTIDGDVPNEEQLQVTGHDPNCDGSCTSPLIQVHFNTNISEDSINPSDFTITEDNNQFIIDSVVLESERTIRLEYTTPLNAGSTYEVTIPTSFSNVFGDNLDSPYLYTFTTGSDECVVDSVDVNPANAVSDATGDLTSFTAEPIDSSASCDIPIYCPNCLYSWSSTNTGIASIQSGSTIETVVLQTVLTSGYGQTKAEVVLTDDGNEHLDDGILDVTIDGDVPEVPVNPMVQDIQPADESSSVCPNTAILMDFTEQMNWDSLRDYVKLYNYNDGDLLEINGSYILQNNDLDGDGDLETQLIFNPNSYLDSSYSYIIYINENVESIEGLTLDNTQILDDIDNDETNDGYATSFTTWSNFCEISYTLINPNLYTYYQSNYAQDFTAETYDISGTLLNSIDLNYSWDIHDLTLVTLTDNSNQVVTGTSLNENGNTTLTVDVDGGDLGSASASANIDLFFCENPWPLDADGYFDFYNDFDQLPPNGNMHFKTRYCKDYTEGVLQDVVTVGFEDGNIDGVPINWDSYIQAHTSVGITNLESRTGSQSYLITQDPNEPYPGTCSQASCDGNGSGSWPDSYSSASNCTWGGSQCTMNNGNVYNVDDSFEWPDTNRVTYASTAYQVGNLNWKYGEEYTIQFYYKGYTDSQIEPRLSYTLGWGSQCAAINGPSGNICTNNGGSYETCEAQTTHCCVNHPHQTSCYNEQLLGIAIPAGIYNDWTLYEGNFIYDDEVARLLDSNGNLHFELGLSVGYNTTDSDGTEFYVDDFSITGETLPALPDEPLQIPITEPDLLQDFMFPIVNLDIDNFIGIRVYANPQHLSAQEWYNAHAPNPSGGGTEVLIDGYPAYRVGNTIYISATNIADENNPETSLYTNIYLLAYNIGAGEATINIFNQLIEEMEFNTNIVRDNNICVTNNHLPCISDFDCPGSDTCESNSLELRRDFQRLSDLVNIRDNLSEYSLEHLACSNDSNITCVVDDNCPSGGTCEAYYPLLSSGTFVSGMSNSRWPSWQDTLSTTLGYSLPLDPINLFNGYTEGSDPETCWNEDLGEFTCPFNSLLYLYDNTSVSNGDNTNSGWDYNLASDFEFNENGITFANNLHPQTINNMEYLSADLGLYCNDTPIISSSGLGSTYCGDGNVDDSETCEPGEYMNNGCLIAYEDYGWWKEQIVGCNPAGSPNECTWYTPTREQCGGYCGDNEFQLNYELCEIINGSDFFNNIEYHCEEELEYYCDVSEATGDSCQPICTNGTPASACLDNQYTPLAEECDPTGDPDGLDGWDCTGNGDISCTNSCFRECTIGTAYEGVCGDGITQDQNYFPPGLEECDYSGYSSPIPDDSNASNAYGCNINCTFTDEYCGNSLYEYSFEELCDYNDATGDYNIGWEMPEPHEATDENHQYQCRSVSSDSYTRCTPTAGGYCGDDISQDGTGSTINAGEHCDGIDYDIPNPADSNPDNQYSCAINCEFSTGGYCGDGDVTGPEQCDTLGFIQPLPHESNQSWPYACVDCYDEGGYCGDNIIQNGDGDPVSDTTDYSETCDIGNFTEPTPQESSASWQYECNGCYAGGGYCGDGNVDDTYEECEGNISCSNYDSQYIAGQIECGNSDTENACEVISTASCCNENKLSAKFLVDNEFTLWVNNNEVGSGSNWQYCDDDNMGACEFEIDDNDIFDFNNNENVLSFKAIDIGVLYGVIGTFSCQLMTCKSICYKGSNAGNQCDNNSDCPSGWCIHPAVGKEGDSCTENTDCKGYTLDNPDDNDIDNDGTNEGVDSPWRHRPSLCLSDDFGITTRHDGLWKCTYGDEPSEGWKEPGYTEGSEWISPVASWFSSAWSSQSHSSYWAHMVPGAESIWADGAAANDTIYCRYSIFQ